MSRSTGHCAWTEQEFCIGCASCWLAAGIEFAIVVVGILLFALQVTNWNQDRVDRERGARFEARLREELITDRSAMNEALAFWRRVSEFGIGAMEIWP